MGTGHKLHAYTNRKAGSEEVEIARVVFITSRDIQN